MGEFDDVKKLSACKNGSLLLRVIEVSAVSVSALKRDKQFLQCVQYHKWCLAIHTNVIVLRMTSMGPKACTERL
jgi:hypothetical protein